MKLTEISLEVMTTYRLTRMDSAGVIWSRNSAFLRICCLGNCESQIVMHKTKRSSGA